MNHDSMKFRKSTGVDGTDISVDRRGNLDINVPRFRDSVHWHEKFELEFLDEGEAMHIINNMSHPLHRHDVYLLTPSDIHTLHRSSPLKSSLLTVTCIQFTNNIISDALFHELMSLQQPAYVSLTEEEYQSMQYVVALVEHEISKKTESSMRAVKHLMSYILISFIELYYQKNQHIITNQSSVNQKDLKYINQAISYINYNFKNPELSTKSIADMLYLSPNYFGEIFYKKMGISCLEYIKKIKLNYATSLLTQSNLSITEVAERSGYSSISYFISDFKKYIGTTPLKYRQTHHAT